MWLLLIIRWLFCKFHHSISVETFSSFRLSRTPSAGVLSPLSENHHQNASLLDGARLGSASWYFVERLNDLFFAFRLCEDFVGRNPELFGKQLSWLPSKLRSKIDKRVAFFSAATPRLTAWKGLFFFKSSKTLSPAVITKWFSFFCI